MKQYVQHDMFVREVAAARPAVGATGPGGDQRASSQTLLYIHGLGESGLCFEHLLPRPELAACRQLLPDLPGYGRSVWCEGEPLSLAEQADHLATWLETLGCGPVTAIGHSMGGIVALLLAERHPGLVDLLIDVDGNKSVDDCVFSSRATAYSQSEFLAGGFDVLRETVHRRGRKDPAQRGYYTSLRLADPRAYYRNSVELLELSAPEDLAERLAALPMPTHYIAGVPNGISARSRRLLTDARVAWTAVEPSGHWPFIDQADAFIEILVRLLG